MKAYIVWYDNGEEYEDNYQCIEKIFATREAAEEYLDEEYERFDCMLGGTGWKIPEFVCSMGNIDCRKCPKYNEFMACETGFCCEEEEKRFDSSFYKYARWTVQEWEVSER